MIVELNLYRIRFVLHKSVRYFIDDNDTYERIARQLVNTFSMREINKVIRVFAVYAGAVPSCIRITTARAISCCYDDGLVQKSIYICIYVTI